MATHNNSAGLSEDHPSVTWVRRELLPLLVERWAPAQVVVFDPPDRPASLGDAPPGLLVVAQRFEGLPMPERNAALVASLTDAAPVRPLCLTPAEFARIKDVPGPVLAAARTGVALL